MAACAKCGREVEVSPDGRLACPACDGREAPQFETVEPVTPKRQKSLPISFYILSPTVWLIAINVIVFLVECALSRRINIDVETLIRMGANFGLLTLGGQPWRLLTATFLHGGFFHIALNMWALLNLGILAEILFTRRVYVAMYFLTGLFASLASVWWHFHSGNSGVVGVGASGAIFGIAGALIPALAMQKNARLRVALKGNLTSIAIFVIYTVAFGVRESHIDNSAHLGGLAAGLLLGFLLPSSPGHEGEHHGTRRGAVLLLATAGLLAGFYWVQKSQVGVLEFALGQRSFQKKDVAGAIAHLKLSMQKDPKLVEPHYLLGLIYLEQSRNEEAQAEFSAATRIAPTWANAHSQLCIADLRLRDVTAALASCKRAVELNPRDPDMQFNLGLTQRANEDVEGALQSFGAAQRLRPGGFDEEAMLGETLIDAGRSDEAIPHLQRALKARPNDRHVRIVLARLYIQRGQRDEAQKLFSK